MSDNLLEALIAERDRVRDLIVVYEGLPNNAGAIGAILLREDVDRATRAITLGDIGEMVKCLAALRGCE